MNQAPSEYAPTEDKPHPYKQIKVGLINQAPTVNQIPAIPLNNIDISYPQYKILPRSSSHL